VTQEAATLAADVPATVTDPINAQILAISEDQLVGFVEEPFAEIAHRAGMDEQTVIERLRAMLEAGTIRRIRQTLMANNLAPGALVAWRLPAERLDTAFDFLAREDPFSGHVVIRSTDAETPGSAYRLWTTLKVPQGFSVERHCELLRTIIGADAFRVMPAKRLFTLGVGHVRRRDLPPGSRSDEPGKAIDTEVLEMSDTEWRALEPLKREFTVEEIAPSPWTARAAQCDMSLAEFAGVARGLQEKGVLGRFSTFLEHVKPTAGGVRVTRYNALFHWRVPEGREIEAGREIGRHHILTHAYWREGGPEFADVNVMAVAHGTDKTVVLEHKAAIDRHMEDGGIPILYTNVFWGGRSEIKPSEILPQEYERWCRARGVDPDTMRG
jgi:DNA-binding Lrp family transcriptional regulator